MKQCWIFSGKKESHKCTKKELEQPNCKGLKSEFSKYTMLSQISLVTKVLFLMRMSYAQLKKNPLISMKRE